MSAARQRGRLRGANVIDVEPTRDDILRGVERGPGRRRSARGLRGRANPYGDGAAAARIVAVLRAVSLDARLLQKRFVESREGAMRERRDLLVRDGATLREVARGDHAERQADRARGGRATTGSSASSPTATSGRAILRGVSLEGKVDEVMNRHPVVGAGGAGPARRPSPSCGRGPSASCRSSTPSAGWWTSSLLDDLLAPPPPLPACAVIMAGGEGRRLRPLTEATPKPLLSVGGKPLVEILIERLRQSGIAHVLVALHHKSEMIRERLGDGARLGVRMDYVEEPRPLGTMGALPLLRDRLHGPFFVVNADILTKCDFRAMWDFHQTEGPARHDGGRVHPPGGHPLR